VIVSANDLMSSCICLRYVAVYLRTLDFVSMKFVLKTEPLDVFIGALDFQAFKINRFAVKSWRSACS